MSLSRNNLRLELVESRNIPCEHVNFQIYRIADIFLAQRRHLQGVRDDIDPEGRILDFVDGQRYAVDRD